MSVKTPTISIENRSSNQLDFLALIQRTFDGIASRSQDDGAEGFGRYAQVISLGKALWQSASLTSEEKKQIQEHRFDEEDNFPASQVAIKLVREL